MKWKCFVDDHINDESLSRCEICGTGRNAAAENLEIEKTLLEEKYKTLTAEINKANKSNQRFLSILQQKDDQIKSIETRSNTIIHEKSVLDKSLKSLENALKTKTEQVTDKENLIRELLLKKEALEEQISNFKLSKSKPVIYLILCGIVFVTFGFAMGVTYKEKRIIKPHVSIPSFCSWIADPDRMPDSSFKNLLINFKELEKISLSNRSSSKNKAFIYVIMRTPHPYFRNTNERLAYISSFDFSDSSAVDQIIAPNNVWTKKLLQQCQSRATNN